MGVLEGVVSVHLQTADKLTSREEGSTLRPDGPPLTKGSTVYCTKIIAYKVLFTRYYSLK
jgi:hypothetical protein